MAEKVVKVQVQVADNGTLKASTKEAEALAGGLEKARQASKRLSSESKALAAAKERSGGLGEGREYGVARSAVGTGAGARDFAKQAQGLGGLVHLYATFAANLFAVGAAYTALSKAADTANMVEGLNQLGASSGRALGTLAKQLVAATDGALSLKDALTATSQASSGGLSDSQILRIGDVAKKASLALGRDVGDSISRLTRGIVKIEPELLDELGILVRVDAAAQNYARSIGKSALALTQFEKSQAFANAVLEQGEKKFANINIDANPYQKLLASITNLTSSGLQLVNTVIAPLVKLLAESPTGLAVAMAAIGAALLKQALPAIGHFRESAAQAEAEAKDIAVRRAKEAENATKIRISQAKHAAESVAEAEIAATDAAYKRIQDSTKVKKGSAAASIMSKAAHEITPDEMAKLESTANRLRTRGNLEAAAGYDEFTKAVKNHIAAENNYLQLQGKLEEVDTKKASRFSILGQLQRSAEAAQQRATQLAIKNAATETVYTEGLGAAYRQLSDQTTAARKSGELTTWQAGWTKFTGTIGIATTAMSVFASAVGNVFAVVGAIVAVYQVLNYAFSKNSKEVDKFNSALDDTHNAGQLVIDTLDNIAKKDMDKIFSVESVLATASAMNTLTASLDKLNETLNKADVTASGFDRFMDGIFSVVGRDLQSKFAKEFSYGLAAGIRGIEEGPAKDELRTKLNQILGTKDLSFEGLDKAINALPSDKVVATGKAIKTAMEQAEKPAQAAAKSLKEVEDAFSAVNITYSNLTKSLAGNDPMSKLGTDMLSAGLSMQDAFKAPKNALLELKGIIGDVNKFKLFDETDQKNLLAASNAIEQVNKETAVYNDRIDAANKALAENPYNPMVRKEQGGLLANAKAGKAEQENRAKQLTEQFSGLYTNIIQKGVELVGKQLTIAMQNASIAFAKAVTSGISGVGSAVIQDSLKQQEIKIQLDQLEVSKKLAEAQERATLALEENTLSNKIASEKDPAKAAELSKLLNTVQDAQSKIASGEINTVDKFLALPAELQKMLKGTFEAGIGAKAKQIGLEGESRASSATAVLGTMGENAAEQQRQIQVRETLKNLEVDRLKLLTTGSDVADKTLLSMQQQAQLGAMDIAKEKLLADIKSKQDTGTKRLEYLAAEKGVSSDIYKAAADNLKVVQATGAASLKELEAKQALSKIATEAETLKNNAAEQKRADTLHYNMQLSDYEAQTAALDLRKTELGLVTSIGGISKEASVSRLESLDLETAEMENQNKLMQLRYAATQELNSISLVAATQKLSAKTPEEKSGIDAQESAAKKVVNTLLEKQLSTQDKVNKSRKDGIALLAKEQKATATIESIVESLGKAFGDLGGAVGNVFKVMSDIGRKRVALTEDTEQRVAAVKEKYGDDTLGAFIATTEIEKQAAIEREKQDIDSYANMAGAAKNMFDEKSTAYQVLGGIEKAMHIAKLAMWAKEMIVDVATTGVSIANSGARAAADGAAAVVKTLASLPFPANVVAGVAMAAIVAGILGSLGVGSGPKVNTAGMTAKDVQETQGTGTSWKDGQKVENGGGVLGDAAAKSESISKSLEIMKANSIEGLNFDNKMLAALESIDAGINKAAIGLYGAAGLRTGSAFGTEDGAKTKTGSTSLLDTISANLKAVFTPWTLFSGNIVDNIKATFGWGSKSTAEILDSGIAIKGTFKDLMNGVKNTIQGFETQKVSTTSSSWFGLKNDYSESVNKVFGSLNTDITNSITEIFSNAGTLFTEAGKRVGMTETDVLNKLANVQIDQLASLKGLKGAELEKEFSAVVSSILDSASNSLFANLKKYQKFGEGMLQTVIRLADTNDKFNNAMTAIGKTVKDTASTSGKASIDLSEALVTAVGGLDNFTNQIQFFRDNFMTEAEKLAPVQKAVADRMAQLGYASVDTRDEFKALILSLDLTSESQRTLYANLMALSKSFADVHEASTVALSDADFKSKSLSLEIEKQRLLGNVTLSVAMAREQELEQLAKLPDAQKNFLVYNQRVIWALQDAIEQRKLEGDLLSAQGYAYAALQVQRELELHTLTDEQRAIKKKIYAAEDAVKTEGLLVQIMELSGKSLEATAIKRKIELAALSKTDAALQSTIYALEDEAAIRDKLIAQRDVETSALEGVISGTQDYIKVLKDYRTSLLLGDSSTLNPNQKYDVAKNEALRLASIANSTATTDAEKKIQQDALDKLPAATSAWLDASKTLFASSDAYTRDFNTVLRILDETQSSAEARLTDAQQQLAVLNSTKDILGTIEGNTATAAELLKQFLEAKAAADKSMADSGALASIGSSGALDQSALGILSVVLAAAMDAVNKLNPTNTPTPTVKIPGIDPSNVASIQSVNSDLAKQVAALTQEVATLRAEQKEQTGQLIASNYDANNRAAEAVSASNENTAAMTVWSTRASVTLV